MNWKRVVALVITSPIWLLATFIIVGVCIPLGFAALVISLVDYGFNGEWPKL